jgi:hypothetical protein
VHTAYTPRSQVPPSLPARADEVISETSRVNWPSRQRGSAACAHAQAPAPQTQRRTANLPRIEVVRVRPIDATNLQFRLGNGPVDLMRDFSLSSSRGIGASWETPAYIASSDTFDQRYSEW